jgi:hypothetical protein
MKLRAKTFNIAEAHAGGFHDAVCTGPKDLFL